MRNQQAKIVLPTVDTCRWRSANGSDDLARCDLLSSLMGGAASELSTVSRDACEACCQSFPPFPHQLNPVVAGLLYAAAARTIAQGGLPGLNVDNARRLQQKAERSLPLVFPEHLRLTPAREVGPCGWLGEAVQPSNGQAGSSDASETDQVHVCRHPAHELTTASACRMCRDWVKRPPISRMLSLAEIVPPPAQRSGPAVKRWAVGVTTAPRRRSTLESCLDSLVRAGWEEPRLFLDGSMHLPSRYYGLPVTWRESRIGAWPAWRMALAELFFQQPDADAYLMIQDDVVLYDREPLRDYLEQVLWPGDRPGIVSLFYTGLAETPGWHCSAGEWHWGSQAFLFAPGAVRALLADANVALTWLAASGLSHIPIPEAIHEWVRRTGIDVWYANPSLAQHIGNTSTIWFDAAIIGGRRAHWFSGSIETEFAAEESLEDFPEFAFTCDPAVHNEYAAGVDRGRERMRDASVVICGLCRDARLFLPRMAARIERLGSMFRDYRVVLFENDSVDATREFLVDWQSANPRVEVISESLGVHRYPQVRSLERAAWLAQCRNRYRDRIVARYADFDYAIVADMDLPGGWSFEGVAHTFGQDDWDFVGSNGLLHRLGKSPEQSPFVHFDVWAFRPARGTAARKLVNHHELHLRRGEPLLPVESCFGGLGVYRMQCMRAAEYGGGDCEHVVFHERLRRAGFDRLFLNPSQIVLYSPA